MASPMLGALLPEEEENDRGIQAAVIRTEAAADRIRARSTRGIQVASAMPRLVTNAPCGQDHARHEQDARPALKRPAMGRGHRGRQQCQPGDKAVASQPLAEDQGAGGERRREQDVEAAPGSLLGQVGGSQQAEQAQADRGLKAVEQACPDGAPGSRQGTLRHRQDREEQGSDDVESPAASGATMRTGRCGIPARRPGAVESRDRRPWKGKRESQDRRRGSARTRSEPPVSIATPPGPRFPGPGPSSPPGSSILHSDR